MATVISNTIGTGGTYPTLQEWENACPVDLVAVDQIWQGRLLAGEHVYSGVPLSIGSSTVANASCYIELTTDAGASFLDHAGIATNPLRYDATKGASIRYTGTGAAAIVVNADYTRINKIQVLCTATTSEAHGAILMTSATPNDIDVNQCILESACRQLGSGTVMLKGAGSRIRNSVIVQRSATITSCIAYLSDGAGIYNCTLVSIGSTLTNAINTTGASGTLKNIYVGGAANPHNGGSTMTFSNCYSDVAATGFTQVPFSTATFENITDGTHDFRLKTGSGLLDVGVTDVITGAIDIYGTTRPQGASYDVGAWEKPVVFATPELVIGWTEANDTHGAVVDVEISGAAMAIGWTEANDTHGAVLAVDTASGQLTTGVIRNNNGLPRANLPGCAINIYNATTGALVVRVTGLTTNAEGRLVVLNAALAKNTAYAYEPDLRSAGAGLGRRLPVGTTV